MTRSFAISALPEQATKYRDSHAVVAIDVFRATTTIVTGVAQGRRVFPVPSEQEAMNVAARLTAPLLAGEIAGVRPPTFAMNNSPAALDRTTDRRPLIVLSSAGTRLLALAAGASEVYVACLRNLSATTNDVIERQTRVALIGAGARGLPRPEDSLACAWIGRALLANGFEPEDEASTTEVRRWDGIDIAVLRDGPSADFLRSTGQIDDIDFVLGHIDDLDLVVRYDGQEAIAAGVSAEATP
ncbi:MAG TPA: 2-phosphosulfolactate phosphatase [Candidatus Dormibacteraeota bacterium]|nr:2-phosphosulfolactate phosphatase [Candidatus Dormibacteraeota bacterium]